jgi:hypothetical protein
MRIFLSYARISEPIAAEIELALRAEGHDVFLDRASLRPAEGFHKQIREHIGGADAFVFLISPASIRRGSYALTELRLAQERWRSPQRRVLPVLIAPTPIDDLPPYLRAVTVLEPVGNVAAEVAAAVATLSGARMAGREPDVRVLMHAAYFEHEPDRPAFFVNVTNLAPDRDVEVTHVWIESTPKAHVIHPMRPLPARLRPRESWETWVYFDQLPAIATEDAYGLARVRLSTGEVIESTHNAQVPDFGYVPGHRPT